MTFLDMIIPFCDMVTAHIEIDFFLFINQLKFESVCNFHIDLKPNSIPFDYNSIGKL